jgi:hypothetical protein
MKNAYEVLRLKEVELSRVRTEVEALNIVAPLLSDDGDSGNENLPVTTRWTAPPRPTPSSKGSQYRSTTRSRPGVEDENRGFPITARALLPVAICGLKASYEMLYMKYPKLSEASLLGAGSLRNSGGSDRRRPDRI